MTLRLLHATCGALFLGVSLLPAEVPVDEPVAVIESARSFSWVGAEGNSVLVRPQGLNELWRIDYTPDGAVQSPVSFAIPAGYQVWHATGDQVLLVTGNTWQDSFRTIRPSDGTVLGELPAPGALHLEAPRFTPNGVVAIGDTGSGYQYGYRLLTYDKSASVPVIKSYFTDPQGIGGNLIAATDDWFALLHTESQVGDRVITIRRTSDAGVMRQVTIPWQSGTTSTGAAAGNLLYFKTNDRFLCLDVSTGSLTEVFQFTPSGFSDQFNAVAADSTGLWVYEGRTMELDLYTGSPAGGFHHSFRGKPRGNYSSYSADIEVSGGRCHMSNSYEIQVFDPSLARPRLDRREIPPVREMDGIFPLEISLDRAPDRQVSVHFRTSGGSATPGLDYDPIDQVLTFSAGTRSITVPLHLKADLVPESNETITFEASAPDGIRLASSDLGGLTIVASGMEHRAISLKDASGNAVTGWVQEVLKDVMLGTISNDTRVHLWNRHSGAYLGATDLPHTPSLIVETPAGLETVVRTYQQIELFRIDPATGRTLARRVFTVPTWSGGGIPIGGGRFFLSYQIASSSTLFGKIYALDGPPDGTDFPLFGGAHPGDFSAMSDGRRLVIGWDTNMPWYTPPPGPSRHLRWYSTDTLEVEHEMAVDFSPTPVAIRGDLLLCQGGRAVDLEKQQLVWDRPEMGGFTAIGDTHLVGTSGVWEIATGLKVEEGFQYDSRLPGDAPFTPHLPADGTGGIIVGEMDYRADRQRPGLEWLGTGLRPDEEQARMPLRVSEPSNQPLTASFTLREEALNATGLRPVVLSPTPATVPGDGRIHLQNFRAQPEAFQSTMLRTTHAIEVGISSPASVPLTRKVVLERENSTAPLQYHLVKKFPAIAALTQKGFQMRYSDGRIVLTTGTDYPDVDPNGQVHLLDPATGNLLFSMSDPTPLYRRAFALDAIVQGNKLLVLVRHVPTGVRTGEVYDLTTRALLGTVADPSSGKSFPSYVDSSETHFALGAASLAWWDKKSAVAVFQWSDFKRVLQKSGRAGGGLGNGVDLKGNRFFAGISGSKENDFGLVAQPVGTKLKMPKLPKGLGGQVIPGDPLLYILDRNGVTRAYDPATYREVWSSAEPIHGAIQGPTRHFAWTRRERDISVSDALTGRPLATSRVVRDQDRIFSYYTAAIASPDRLFLKYHNELLAVAPEDLGDFADTRRWKNQPAVLDSPEEDLDGNGQPDFTEYLLHRLPPGGSLGSARIEGGQLVIEEADTPPVDLVSLVEVEIAAGWWYPVAWRDGLGAWVKRSLPAGVTESTPLRMRHLPHPSLGWFPPLLSWPPLAVAIADEGVSVLPDGAGALAAKSAARAAATGTIDGNESQPLRLVNSGNGWGVEYLRLTGEAKPAIAEFSHDLIVWLPVEDGGSLSTTLEPASEGLEKVTIRHTGAAERLFFRLRYPE